MDKAYLIPRGISNGNESPSSLSKNLEPINKIDLRSIFVTPEPGAVYESGKTIELEGLAFDGGDGVSKVEISMDNGKTWISTQLDSSLGKYSWRRWRFSFQPKSKGIYELFVKATGTRGEVQPWHQWNRSGYMRNEIESISIKVKGE